MALQDAKKGRTMGDPEARRVQEAVNAALHAGARPCETACTHVIVGRWTALGIANVIERAEEAHR